MSDDAKTEGTLTFNPEDTITDINQVHVVRTTKNPKRFEIGNTLKLGEYKGGGIATEVKVTKTYKFKSLQDSMAVPDLNPGYMDFTKFENALQLHMGRLAIWEFQVSNIEKESCARSFSPRFLFLLGKEWRSIANPPF